MGKIRLDVLIYEKGLVESRSLAQRLVMAGQVRVDGQVALKPSLLVEPGVKIEISRGPAYVSRGGEKLAAALAAFPVQVRDKICADVGASTGGFTDCLLQYGAARVYAIDVGEGILHWKLRQDRRVVVMEKTNAREVASLPDPIGLATIDVSFISLRIMLPVVKGWLNNGGELIALIKPQFEAGRAEAARGDGVIRDPAIHQRVVEDILAFAQGCGFHIIGWIPSPLLGPKGNVEFLAAMHLK
jgi:23S rRNA (cytidine1920-2'-O)/16S rRNA (cytidine1409-2'-O)-methyltransferase